MLKYFIYSTYVAKYVLLHLAFVSKAIFANCYIVVCIAIVNFFTVKIYEFELPMIVVMSTAKKYFIFSHFLNASCCNTMFNNVFQSVTNLKYFGLYNNNKLQQILRTVKRV